jgi:hypothetical protein
LTPQVCCAKLALQNAGKNKVEQFPDKKDIAQRQLPGRWERVGRKGIAISLAPIIAQVFYLVKPISAALLAGLPEPGKMDRNKVAALVGAASMNYDRGKKQ